MLTACDNSSPYTKGIEKTADAYFRITADYTVIDTGEEINFDYVMVCGGTVTHSTYTSATVSYSTFPNLMLRPTSTGEAVGVNTPALCQAWGWRFVDEIDGRVRDPDPFPDDFTPFTLWYPDVNALGFAFGYESDLAYESPYSRLKFHGSTLLRVDKAAWDAWREKAEAEYEPKGGLPGPWGMGLELGPRYKEVNNEIKSRNKGVLPAIGNCNAVRQLDMPEEYATRAAALMSETSADFLELNYTGTDELKSFQNDILSERRRLFNGGSLNQHRGIASALGVRRSDTGELRSKPVRRRSGTISEGYVIAVGGGRINRSNGRGNFYHHVFPVLWRDLSVSEQFQDDGPFLSNIVLIQPEWNGFSFCRGGGVQINLDDIMAYVQRRSSRIPANHNQEENWAAFEAMPKRLYFNEDEVLRTPDDRLPYRPFSGWTTIIDREGHVYPYCCGNRR